MTSSGEKKTKTFFKVDWLKLGKAFFYIVDIAVFIAIAIYLYKELFG